MTLNLDALDFAKGNGLVTVITQDAVTGTVLMVAHADREALERTIETREMHYTSRRRGLWHKGATSGNRQRVVSLSADCDGDAVLARVEPMGPACHNGTISCFGDEALKGDELSTLDRTIAERATQSAEEKPSYTKRLLADRNLRLKKLGEEVAEFVTACADEDRERASEEAADIVYHTLVALHAAGADWSAIRNVLHRRNTRANGKDGPLQTAPTGMR